ncbi:MAG: bifunctional demethylmenaquinone methyltransferase/2-methoxy-6-polyprenyl-1,4-benzoquinol methylase UbiE [Verrucomicrobiota bacterium]|nr:bifunctional demethylmenaquinone methyltransferase/2-methoxy-6-polyprenyl-1,4-benzoquinol methylase UbiE [Verrucomicrobiota bacterium]
MNKFFQPGEQRAEKVADLFTAIAPHYDLINDLQSIGLHRYWKRKLLNLAKVKCGEHALDLCCGTGDISFALAKRGAEVVGLDFNEAMLKIAELKIQNSKFKTVPKFLQADAQQIPFPDAHFDIVTISYGLRNLTSWERGLEEMKRVVKPGGRLLALDFGKPENALWRRLYFFYLKNFEPLFGKLFCGDSETYAYPFESLKNYPAQKGVAEKMRALNCSSVRIVNLLGGMMSINYAEKNKRR